MSSLGEQARTYRRAKELSQRETATKAGMGASHLWEWEVGKCDTSMRYVFAIGKALSGVLMFGDVAVANYAELATAMTERRFELAMTQGEAHRASGASQSALRSYESGRLARAYASRVQEYCTFLGRPLRYEFPA
jgi:transcriptional regulator with XRE-family HTH domain